MSEQAVSDEVTGVNEQGVARRKWEYRREVRTSASPERAWRAWADPPIIQGWFADEAEGEAKVGGTLVHRFPAMGFEIRHDVVAMDPGRRLSLRVEFPGRPAMTQEIVVRSEAGQTVIEMVSSGFGAEEWDGQYEGIDSGWQMAFAQLAHYLERWFGRGRSVWLSLRPVAVEADAVVRYFREAGGLASWLTREPSATTPVSFVRSAVGSPTSDGSTRSATAAKHGLGEEGSAVSLALRDFGSLTGSVLAWTGTEAMLSWDELEGTLELKSFGTGPGSRMVGLRFSSWRTQSPPRHDVQRWLDGAVARLARVLAG